MSNEMNDVLKRLRRIEDREEIRDLVGRYTLAIDDMDLAAITSLFTPTSRFGWIDGGAIKEGREAIIEYYRGRFGKREPKFHTTNDQFVEWDPVDENRASGLVAGHTETWNGGEQYVSAIRYQDKYAKHEGRWKFQERLLTFLYFCPVSEYSRILGEANRLNVYGNSRPGHWPKV